MIVAQKVIIPDAGFSYNVQLAQYSPDYSVTITTAVLTVGIV